ncbi:protein phosphatase 3 regulatory subunit b alpha isoform type 1 [Anaeramoeba ignava]|uniref:Protein phosphatase 3 regulatory subunit b alpha isoform type 1 n=1 Tax=Anaeramoeba ignava TaxID=1746090 RepID=A0A9Q0RBC0_ANAIG|nr:protein phosphatase 3 regulatory subunit b alpha isoform type 1 [Anaeramoeba ignava]
MGNTAPYKVLTQTELSELQENTNLSQKQIISLFKRFEALDKDDTGIITYDKLFSIPELAMNPLVLRVIGLFDPKEPDPEKIQFNFTQFIQTLSVFSEKASNEEKIRFAFQSYDVSNSGFIDSDNMKKILKFFVGDCLNEKQISEIIQKTFEEYDKEKNGKISFEDFQKIIDIDDICDKMTILI